MKVEANGPDAKYLLRQLVDALPKTEFWTPKLHAAEKAARAFLNPDKNRKIKIFFVPTRRTMHP
jgi:hypothetical protein